MKSINVNSAYTEIIPLANHTSTETLAYTIWKQSDNSTFASGNLTYQVGKQWSLTFTPLVLDEIYMVEVVDADGDVIFTESYKAVTSVTSEAESTAVTITKTALANEALMLIGAESITSIDDGTPNAEIMTIAYEKALKSILSECMWGFATKRALLTSAASISLAWSHDDESYQYTKPSDIIRIFSTNDDQAIWRDEGTAIVSDTAGLGIKYVYFNDTPSTYPASFVAAFIDLLASKAAYTILNNATKAAEMFEKYETVSLPKAMSENSQVGTQQYVIDNAWVDAKNNNDNPDA